MMKGLSISTLYAAILFILALILYFVIFYMPAKTADLSIIGGAFEQACKHGNYSINVSLGGEKHLTIDKNMNIIVASGDPSYVLYYEFFPPLDDVSWLYWIRGDIPAVVYSWLDDVHASDVESYREHLQELAKVHVPDREIKVIFINQRLSSPDLSLNRDNAIFEKHMTCAEHALCLKHGSKVRGYELKECEKRGYDHVMLYSPYIMRLNYHIPTAGGPLFGMKLEDISRSLGVSKPEMGYYPFYLASPCYGEAMSINATECECNEIVRSLYDEDGKPVGNISWCDNYHIFGDFPEKKVKCLKVEITPHYSRSYCYNHDLSNQIRYPDSWHEFVNKYLKGMDMKSVRKDCIIKLDDNSVLLNPSCMEKMTVKFGIKSSVWEGLKHMFLGQRSETSSKFMSVWPVDVYAR